MMSDIFGPLSGAYSQYEAQSAFDQQTAMANQATYANYIPISPPPVYCYACGEKLVPVKTGTFNTQTGEADTTLKCPVRTCGHEGYRHEFSDREYEGPWFWRTAYRTCKFCGARE